MYKKLPLSQECFTDFSAEGKSIGMITINN